jgi:hypothetical protein
MKKLSFVKRLQLVAAGIDFLLNHPQLKFSDLLAGLMILRQTVLFGKLSDTMILRQLSEGVRNLNRGTGRTPRRLSLATARLQKVGFLRTRRAEHGWQGNTYELCVDNILTHVREFRQPASSAEGESNNSRHRLAPDPSLLHSANTHSRLPEGESVLGTSNGSPAPGAQEMEILEAELNAILSQLRIPLPPPDRSTCMNLFEGARRNSPDATPNEIAWFVRDILVDRPTRFRTWGGVVTAVRGDFGRLQGRIR